jgi:flagellar motor switch protein FliN/FliY
MADEKDLNGAQEQDVPEENSNEQSSEEQNSEMESGNAEMTEMPEEAAAESEGSSDADSEASDDPNKIVNEDDVGEDDAEAAMMAMLDELPDDENKPDVSDINFPQQEVSNVEFQHLSQPAGQTEAKNIDMLMDVNLPISIELGRTKMTISDILALGPGSVVELNKLAGEPVDLLINQRVVARGEVVVIDENFGVRVTQLMTPEERLKALGEEY